MAVQPEIHESAVISKTFMHLGQFFLRRQEHGKNLENPALMGVKTPR
jgi:hypothetical protein